MRPSSRLALLVSFATLCALLSPPTAVAQRVSILWDGDHHDGDGGVSANSQARRFALEKLGFPVRFDNPNNDQSWYNTYGATSLYEVIYVTGETDLDALGDKLRDHQTAVIYEPPQMDDNFGLASLEGLAADGTQIQIDTVAHPVTSNSFLGNANLYTSANPISVLQGTPAASLQALASQGGQTCLAVVETGGALANTVGSNSAATTRRVRLPFGADEANWSEVTGSTLNLLEQAVVWASAPDYSPTGVAGVCVMITADNGVLNSEETWRVRRMAYDGWNVILMWDGDSQANYDTAVAAADVVYVTTDADATAVGDKLRNATCGVVYENNELDDNFGLATGGGVRSSSTGFYTRDREHPITANMYLDEYVSCFYRHDYAANNHPGVNHELGRMSGTLAPDLRVLGTRWSDPVLAAIDTGEQLANTIGGNDTAAGRRVRLPWVGTADLTSMPSWAEGSQVWYQALRWAANTQTGTLIAHYKLDETSGSTAADSSGNGYNGEYRGGVTQNITPAPRSVAANFDGQGEYIFAPANSDFANLTANNGDFSVAFWIRPHEVTHSEWRNIFHIGGATSSDRGPLIMLHPTLRRFYCWVSTTNVPTGTGGYSLFEVDNDEWVHVTVVKSGSNMRWYLDGEFVNTVIVNGESVATQGDLRIGEQSWWGRPDADLDDVRVYSYALADQEIRELHADLVLHFKLDETSGTVAEDSSVFGNDGTVQGSSTLGVEGAIETAFTFDDNGDHVLVPQSASLDATASADSGDHTLAFWIKPHMAGVGQWRSLFSKGSVDIPRGAGAYLHQNNNRVHYTIATTHAGHERVDTTKELPVGQWSHVAYVVRGQEARIFINGVEEALTNLVGTVTGMTGPVRVGSHIYSNPEADMDDVRLYNRALSDTEVFELGGSGLRLHLKLDETSGTVAEDSSPYGVDGTYEGGATLGEDGLVNTAVGLDGSNGAVRVADGGALNTTDQITVSAWVRPDTLSSWRRIASKGTNEGYQLRIATGGYIDFQCYLQGGASPNVTSTRAVPSDRWSHVTATYDGATLRLYLDGELDAAVGSPGLISASTSDFLVGITPSGFGAFDGSIDDVRVYAKALDAEEVAYLHGLIGHWRLDEVAGAATAVDETVFAQDGNYLNTPTLEEESPYPSDAVRTAARFEPGQYVQVPAAEHLEVGTDNADFSVAFWLRNNRENSGQWREVTKKHVSSRERTFAMWLYPHDERLYFPISTKHSWAEAAYSIAEFDVGVWRHVAYVKRGSQVRLYVDGVLDSINQLDGAVYSNNGSIYFGVRSAAWRSDVSIDDYRLYSRALNDWEVAELHGLVGWYRMEDMAGTVATDSSGMKNHGAVIGGTPAWPIDAREGSGSIELNGTNYIEAPDLPVDGPGAAISGWAKLSDTGTVPGELVSLGDTLAIRLDSTWSGGTLAFGYNGSSHQEAVTPRYFKGAGWRHFSASYRSDLRELSFYIDGVLVTTEVLTTDLDLTSLGSTLTIGQHGNGETNKYFSGQIDDVKVYNRPISRAEARSLYYGGDVPGLRIVKWVEVATP